jgi:hypothetical protein
MLMLSSISMCMAGTNGMIRQEDCKVAEDCPCSVYQSPVKRAATNNDE